MNSDSSEYLSPRVIAKAINDPARLAALSRTGLLDSPAEPAFDRLARLASRLLGTPVVLVSLVDGERQFFKSCPGLPEPWSDRRETPLSHSFCKLVVTTGRPLVVHDARQDPRVWRNPAIAELGVAAYLGIPMLDQDNRVLGSFCGIDVVPHEWSEEDIEVLSDLTDAIMTEVALRVEVAERRKIEADLRQAREEALAANRAKSDFLAHMSHEIRTPIGAILGHCGLLLAPEAGANRPEKSIRAIERNGRHLLQVINEILDLAKVEAGQLTVDLGRHAPWTIALDVLATLGIRAAEKGIALEARPVGMIPAEILVDPTWARQILVNLVGNAIKFTSAGKRIEVRMRVEDGSDRSLLVEVEDEGQGMSAEQVDRLFTPFYQAGGPTGGSEKGTGLGLTISRKLARELGGDVTVRSTLGRGSTFTLRLPISDAPWITWVDASDLSGDFHHDEEAVAPPIVSGLSGQILLAEDNADNQWILSHHLNAAGFDVEVVADGRAAVARALAGRFDLIVMDMQMPELDGYAATRSLRAQGHRGPILALTARAMSDDRQACLDAGCSEYLTKPVDPRRLLEVVAGVLVAPGKPAKPAPPVDPELAAMMRDYLRIQSGRPAELRAALRAEDLATVESIAHQTSGSAGMYGFPGLSDAAGRIEEAARGGVPDRLAALIDDLEAEIAVAAGDP